jgi:hypothetical protein
VLGLFLMPETRHMSIWKPFESEAKPAPGRAAVTA